MKKVQIISLCTDKGRLFYDLLNETSLTNFNQSTLCTLTIITQGFEVTETYPNITFIRDDTKYQVGALFGDIRNYYVNTYLDPSYPYLLILDDDMRFCDHFAEQLAAAVAYADNHPNVGMLVFTDKPVESRTYTKITSMWMESGMFVRMAAYIASNKFEPYVHLHDELILAANIYREGYDIERFIVNIFHNRDDYKIGVGTAANRQRFLKLQIKEITTARIVLLECGDLVKVCPGLITFSAALATEHSNKKLARERKQSFSSLVKFDNFPNS